MDEVVPLQGKPELIQIIKVTFGNSGSSDLLAFYKDWDNTDDSCKDNESYYYSNYCDVSRESSP